MCVSVNEIGELALLQVIWKEYSAFNIIPSHDFRSIAILFLVISSWKLHNACTYYILCFIVLYMYVHVVRSEMSVWSDKTHGVAKSEWMLQWGLIEKSVCRIQLRCNKKWKVLSTKKYVTDYCKMHSSFGIVQTRYSQAAAITGHFI